MPRILHIIDSLGRNGTSQQLQLLAQGLAHHGFDVHIAVLTPRPVRAIPHPVSVKDREKDHALTAEELTGAKAIDTNSALPITYLNRRFPLDPLADLRLVQLLSRLQPEIVHTWNTVPGMFGPVASRFLRRFLTGNAPPRLVASRTHIDGCRPEWEAWIERRFAGHASAYVTSSPSVREWCLAQGLPAKKLTIISPGVPPAAASDVSRCELLRELHLPADARLIGVIGRLVPEKRVRDLIWAADLLRARGQGRTTMVVMDERDLDRAVELAMEANRRAVAG